VVDVPPNPSGLCQCGCGGATTIAKCTDRKFGWVKGEPKRFILGHASRGKCLPEADRFWPKVNKHGPIPDERPELGACWVWTACLSDTGYGWFGSEIESNAHRWSWRHVHGPIPEGLHLDHLCRNRRCVNPMHLEPVSNAENVRRGAAAKLTAEQAAEIQRSSLPTRELGRRFGINSGHVSRIRNGERWAGMA